MGLVVIVTYLRSSLLNTFDACENRAFLQYNLGLESPSNLAATKGSIVHKVLECMALAKQAIQNDKQEYDAEELGILPIDTKDDIDLLLHLSVNLYAEKEPQLTISKADIKECKVWIQNAITWHNGAYDPRKLLIVQPEQHFNFEIKENWAKYEYNIGDAHLIGYLGLKGTIDLISMEDQQLLVTDYKTGLRKNWKTFKTKEYSDLEQDIQFLLYYYAVSYLYPEHDSILFTVFFVKDGGPFTFLYNREMLPQIESRIRKYFEEMKRVQVPTP
jgi:ATP-dependent exoDNAse (exonuclease V) beta subunit